MLSMPPQIRDWWDRALIYAKPMLMSLVAKSCTSLSSDRRRVQGRESRDVGGPRQVGNLHISLRSFILAYDVVCAGEESGDYAGLRHLACWSGHALCTDDSNDIRTSALDLVVVGVRTAWWACGHMGMWACGLTSIIVCAVSVEVVHPLVLFRLGS